MCNKLQSSGCGLIWSIILEFAVATEEDSRNYAITGALWTCCAVHAVHHVEAVCTLSHSCSGKRESAIHVGSIHLDADERHRHTASLLEAITTGHRLCNHHRLARAPVFSTFTTTSLFFLVYSFLSSLIHLKDFPSASCLLLLM